MGSFVYKFLYTPALMLGIATPAVASPANWTLLPLVPPGARIVAGFENYRDPHRHGQLLLTTHSDRLDLADWQSITGVDSKRVVDQVVEVADDFLDGELTEHLVLVAGRFDTERIFHSVQMNGAESREFEGQAVMLIKPFEREKNDMVQIRWLAILDGKVGLFGTPSLVQQAIRRYASHANADMILRERLSVLRSDVSSWNVLVGVPRGVKGFLLHPGSRWRPLLEDADVLMIAARFGPKVRVDFSVHAPENRGGDFFRNKANSFAAVFELQRPHSPLRNLLYETNHVQGSIEMSMEQFESWGDQANAPSNPQSQLSRGE